MDDEGLRERKRRRTRAAIADVAMKLFLERGFDQVTMAEIARASEVSVKTVYNYFTTKAALVFDEGDNLLVELLHSVRTRPEGDTALDGVRSYLAGLPEWSAHRRPARPSGRFRKLIADSPRLEDHRRRMFARYETDLARLLAEETGAPIGSAEPFVAAVAFVGVLRAAFEAGASGSGDSTGDSVRCLDLLGGGLDGYATASFRERRGQ